MDWNPDFRKIGMEGLVLLVNGPDEARVAVRKLVKDGVEWVKTYPTGDAAAPDTNDHHTLCMTFEEMHAVVQTAHNHKLKVTGHCRANGGHQERAPGRLRYARARDLHGRRGHGYAAPAEHARRPRASVRVRQHRSWTGIRPSASRDRRPPGDAGRRRKQRASHPPRRWAPGDGRDYGFAWTPHGTYAKELTFFVKHVGFSPLETIMCATKTGAEIMGRDKEIGTLEAGKLADVLVVEGDVLEDISLLEERANILAVIQGGKIKAGRLANATG